jgi:ABC-2 type transport system ATP-binding protein
VSDPLVVIQGVQKVFDPQIPPALQNINAQISKGEIVGLVGPDGAGKTTLIRLIAALMLPTEGSITLSGFNTAQDPEIIHFLTGYMPQRFGLYDDLTVQQNLNLYADLRNVIGEERKTTIARLLKFTTLEPFTNRLAKNLSGGMKQKLGLACALIRKPTLLLLDEPSVGVDPISRRELWSMVHELLADDISVVWSTSYLDEAEKCNSVILLNEGKVLYQGTANNLTKEVEGKTFLITDIGQYKRKVLSLALSLPDVIDGTIQSDDIRLVTKDKSPPNLENLHLSQKLVLIPVKPRFEDAFMNLLGGGPGGRSVLSEKMPEVHSKEEIVIKAEHLTKKFGDFTATNDVSFEVKRKEIFGLLGPNGAGKSTTFKMLCGLLTPTSGKAIVNGLDLQIAPGEARSHIGYMAQKFSLYGDLSVLQNLKFFSGVYNVPPKEQKRIIDEMISIFDLKPYLNESASELPLGFKQRLALSCAVMHHPEVLFLDEPTSGVDPYTRREFWNHINGLVEKGVTVMVTTHFMDEAEYCDRIGLVYQSKLIRLGTPDSLKKEAATKENPHPTLEDAFIQLIEAYKPNE